MVAPALEKMRGQALIHYVVFGNQNLQAPPLLAQGMAGHHESFILRLHFRTEHVDDGLQQVNLADRFGEVSGYPQFAAAGRIAALASGGYHDDHACRPVPDLS